MTSSAQSSDPSSAPTGYPRITPYLNYEDTGAMLQWLNRAFGMTVRHSMKAADGTIQHAEMALEDSVVMLGSPAGAFKNPKHLGQATQSLYIIVGDIEAHFERASAAGAHVLEAPTNQAYGHRRYGVSDPEGHHWYFATPLENATDSAGS